MVFMGFVGPAGPVGPVGPMRPDPILSAALNFGARTLNLGNIKANHQKFLLCKNKLTNFVLIW